MFWPPNSLAHGVHQDLHCRSDVVVIDERHLDVELRELDRTIGARILIAHAARDLHVFAEAADHQNLLEQLRRLGECVEASRIEPRGHDVVACALGCALDEHRRLDFDEVARVEEIAHRLDDVVTQPQVPLHARTAQVEIPVLEPQVLVDAGIEVDLERRNLRPVENLQRLDTQFHLAGAEGGILGAGGPFAHGAGDAKHVLAAQVLGVFETGLLRIENDLRNAVAIA